MTYIITNDDTHPFVLVSSMLAYAKYFAGRNKPTNDEDETVPKLVMADFFRDIPSRNKLH